jgi:hypothetical protein
VSGEAKQLPDKQPSLSPSLAYASAGVDCSDLDPKLVFTVRWIAQVHELLFGTQLVITSGRDGKHAPGSAHDVGKAVDVRTGDLGLDAQLMFVIVAGYIARMQGCGVFDERMLPGAPHLHLEVLG